MFKSSLWIFSINANSLRLKVSIFNTIDFNDLIEREGCTVTMYISDTNFIGSTKYEPHS